MGQEDPLEEEIVTHSSGLLFLPGEYYGQRSLVGYNPKGSKQSDMTKDRSKKEKKKKKEQRKMHKAVRTQQDPSQNQRWGLWGEASS